MLQPKCFLLPCLVLYFSLSPSLCAAASPKQRKQHVRFSNQLQNKVLNVNCKNQQPYIDLGLQILLPKQEYTFDYAANKTMLYSCNLRHGDTRTAFKVSDGATRRECGANKCVWKAAEDGVYLLNVKTNVYQFKYEWGKLYSDMHFS